MNKRQLKEVKIYEDVIEVKKTGTIARVIAPNYKTGSGTNPSLVVWDELWAMELERERKFWDELTTVPTRKNPLTLVVSYAGFDELSLLYELYKKGLKKSDKEMFFIWSHRNLASWVTKKYLDKQRERLRPNTFLRLHECRWTSSESAFVSAEQWDNCIDNNLRPILPGFKGQLSVGIDIGYSHDSSSVVGVYREGDRVILGCHKCWIPTKKNPIDIEETVEKYLIELHKNFNVDSFNYDPYQFHRSGISLAKEGLKMCEYPQTTDRLVECGENLYSLIKGRNLVVYEDREIRDHILKAIAKESTRGFRLVKSKQSERIDLSISLAMASLKAIGISPGGTRVRWLEEPEDLSLVERRRQFIENDEDDESHALPESYHQL
jgi:phage terminase large subunit-like protein